MRLSRVALVALVALVSLAACTLSACIGPRMEAQPLVAKELQPSATVGYVGAITKKDTVARVSFGLLNLDTQKEALLSFVSDGTALMEVPPGKYRVAFWIAAVALTGETIGRKVVPETVPLGKPFEVKPGAVVLLGKWRTDREIGFGSSTITIEQLGLDAAGATEALRRDYTHFAAVPTACPACKP